MSYLDPPPPLSLQELGSVPVPDAQAGAYAVAIGDLGVAVGTWVYEGGGPDRIEVIGFDGSYRTIEVAPGLGPIIGYGPGDVAYSSQPGQSTAEFAAVAIALSGQQPGAVVSQVAYDINRFMEYPHATFGHGPSGIVDRRDGIPNSIRVVIGYVDILGRPTSLEAPEMVSFDLDGPAPGDLDVGGRVTSSAGGEWLLRVEPAPDRAGTYVGDSPPAPSANGSGAYWTHIGPNAAPETDFGEPTMWVIAELRPDGSTVWWSLPDGWEVVASDLWGTVLAERDGSSLRLALADFGGRD